MQKPPEMRGLLEMLGEFLLYSVFVLVGGIGFMILASYLLGLLLGGWK